MATQDELTELRRMIAEEDTDTYSDDYLEGLIDSIGATAAARKVWLQKAASFAEQVDISEAGSSRKNSSLYDHAMKMADTYQPDQSTAGGEGVAWPTTRAIVRP